MRLFGVHIDWRKFCFNQRSSEILLALSYICEVVLNLKQLSELPEKLENLSLCTKRVVKHLIGSLIV